MSRFTHKALVMKALVMPLGLLAAAATQAQTQVGFEGRLSVNHLYYFGGFAISGDEGGDGTPPPLATDLKTAIPVTDPSPATLTITGSDHHDIRYLGWSGFLDETWHQTQTYQVQDLGGSVRVAASGLTAITQTSQVCGSPGGCNLASELHWSTNAQSLDFRIDAVTTMHLVGSTTGDQWVDLLIWSDPGQRFVTLIAGFNTTKNLAFDLQRSLQPGLYRVRNNTSLFKGGWDDVAYTWDYSLTLDNATLTTPVPEPGSLAMLLAGGAVLAWRRRRAR